MGEFSEIRCQTSSFNFSNWRLISQSVSQSLSRVWLFATPWTIARQASLSITNSRSPPKPMSIESVMPSNHLILCHPLLLPSIFPSIRVFSNRNWSIIPQDLCFRILPLFQTQGYKWHSNAMFIYFIISQKYLNVKGSHSFSRSKVKSMTMWKTETFSNFCFYFYIHTHY